MDTEITAYTDIKQFIHSISQAVLALASNSPYSHFQDLRLLVLH